MPYWSASEFVLTLPRSVGTITGSSTPLTIDEVATTAARLSLAFDGYAAAAGYAVPVSGSAAAAYEQVREIVWNGLACRVLKTVFPNQGGPGDKMLVAADYCQAYKDAIDALRKGEIKLVGATMDASESSRSLPRSYETTNLFATEGGATAWVSRTTEF
jgi:hypothetical protein